MGNFLRAIFGYAFDFVESRLRYSDSRQFDVDLSVQIRSPRDIALPDMPCWNWEKSSAVEIEDSESVLFSSLRPVFRSKFVPIRLENGHLYTVFFNHSNSLSNIPVVFISLFGFGVCGWVNNIEEIAKERDVYIFDPPGFGRSSRPIFSDDATLAEQQFVCAIEDWRKEVGIEEMILISHAYGAFMAASYAIEHSNRIAHLVLVEPWGFDEKKTADGQQIKPSDWVRILVNALSISTPLTALRVAGSLGSGIPLLKALRPDLRQYFEGNGGEAIYNYIYQCNMQNPSGETAFSTMSYSNGWARRPMVTRLFDPEFPISFVYGSRSWLDCNVGYIMKLENPDSEIDVHVIRGAGHLVNLQQTHLFNQLLLHITSVADITREYVN